MKSYYCLFLIAIFFQADLYAEVSKPASPKPTIQSPGPSNEKEYSDAVVVLIDPKAGMIALSWANEQTQKEEKLSFKVDPDKVDVTNQLNQYLEFPNISVGDHVDLVTIKDQNGKEELVEIMDMNAVGSDA